MCNSNILHKRTPTFEKLHISPSPLKGISSRDYQSDVLEDNYLKILKELGKVFLKIIFSFLGSFFYSMMVSQDLIHFNLLSSSASLLGI
jgi:hypothetical protein